MSKLFKLKQWLTIPECAKYLTTVCGEEVKTADVLLLALEGHLQLSVNLVNGAYMRPCYAIEWESIEFVETSGSHAGVTHHKPKHWRIWTDKNGTFRISSDIVLKLDNGVWDLPLTGDERLAVENEYQKLSGGPNVEPGTGRGTFVKRLDGQMFELQDFPKKLHDRSDDTATVTDINNFRPASALPDDAVFVIRTAALRSFENMIGATASEEKPLGQRERNTLLTIIGALCTEHKVDLSKPFKAAESVCRTLELAGQSLKTDTIAKKLKEAHALLGKPKS